MLFKHGTVYRRPNMPISRAMEIHLNRDNQQATEFLGHQPNSSGEFDFNKSTTTSIIGISG